MKKATTLDEQVALLKGRGLKIEDENKAKEILLDIGYYRLGSYLFPYEISYPNTTGRTHKYKAGACFSDAVELYYFDSDLRYILSKYINRIEINLRTFITYYVSNHYKDDPCWFVNDEIMAQEYIDEFDTDIYNDEFITHPAIDKHHKNHPEDKYAPAWKTIEHLTLGKLFKTFMSLKDPSVQSDIAKHYGINKLSIFISYFNAVRVIRNQCAHGGVLFDMKLSTPLKNGPAGKFNSFTNSNIIGIIEVIKYFTKQISAHRYVELESSINDLTNQIETESVLEILSDVSGFEIFE